MPGRARYGQVQKPHKRYEMAESESSERSRAVFTRNFNRSFESQTEYILLTGDRNPILKWTQKSSCVFQAARCTALELSETPAQALLPNLAHCKVGAESSYNTLRRTRIPNSTRHLNTGEYWWLNSFFAPPKSCTLSYLSTFPLDGLLRCRNKTFRAFSRTLCVPHPFTNEFDE